VKEALTGIARGKAVIQKIQSVSGRHREQARA